MLVCYTERLAMTPENDCWVHFCMGCGNLYVRYLGGVSYDIHNCQQRSSSSSYIEVLKAIWPIRYLKDPLGACLYTREECTKCIK
jgi:hypothetical protein